MPDSDFKDDHDILVTLVANMKELRTKQAENHAEIKGEIHDLRDGFAQRLNLLETHTEALELQKFANVDFVAYRNDHVKEVDAYVREFRTGITELRLWKAKILGIVAAVSVIIPVLVDLIFRFFGK